MVTVIYPFYLLIEQFESCNKIAANFNNILKNIAELEWLHDGFQVSLNHSNSSNMKYL